MRLLKSPIALITVLVLIMIILYKTRPAQPLDIYNQVEFNEMNSEQKSEVLQKIIWGSTEPYKTEHLRISMKINKGVDISKNIIMWDGDIVNADEGLIRIKTSSKNVRSQEFGLIYYGKGMTLLIGESDLDSLEVAYKDPYEFRFVNGSYQLRLDSLSTRLPRSGPFKKAMVQDQKVIIEYINNYNEYKDLNPASKLSEGQYNSYWSTDRDVIKSLVKAAGMVLKELDFVDEVKVMIPFERKRYVVNLSKSKLEKYSGVELEFMRKGWEEYYIDKYIYDEDVRKKFFKKFGKILY